MKYLTCLHVRSGAGSTDKVIWNEEKACLHYALPMNIGSMAHGLDDCTYASL